LERLLRRDICLIALQGALQLLFANPAADLVFERRQRH